MSSLVASLRQDPPPLSQPTLQRDAWLFGPFIVLYPLVIGLDRVNLPSANVKDALKNGRIIAAAIASESRVSPEISSASKSPTTDYEPIQ